jgi:hypothetical protein
VEFMKFGLGRGYNKDNSLFYRNGLVLAREYTINRVVLQVKQEHRRTDTTS